MKIALIGYGKMGKAIEEMALQNGDEIKLKITSTNLQNFTTENLQKCDVAIEFTNPESVVNNVRKCIAAGIPVICGSTGWADDEEKVKQYCIENNGTLLFASNFSIGVNIFFEINKKLASLMATKKEYKVAIEEIHHTQKKDAPSGTAVSLANQILSLQNDISKWVLGAAKAETELSIISKRIDPAAGTHSIKYSSEIDDIEIIHTAHNRKGFAAGALAAAAFVMGKKGIYQMKDVLCI